MKQFKLRASNLNKSFSRKETVFADLSLEIRNGSALSVTGRNGSGKSTLLKVLSTVLKPNSGDISFEIDNMKINNEEIISYLGYVAPYLNLYEEFTPVELFQVFSKIRNHEFDKERIKEMLKRFEIFERRNDQIFKFSSGMKQRVKYILALINDPLILMLDEPSTNLDEYGIAVVEEVVKEFIDSDKAVIIASNDKSEIALCTESLNIMDYKTRVTVK